jgi:hypothetical protein
MEPIYGRVPIYGRERFYEVKKHADAGTPVELIGGQYVVVAVAYDMHTESGYFDVQQIRLANRGESAQRQDTALRDAIRANP